MKTWTVRLGLSLMVVVGLWTNRLPAQELIAPPGQVFVVPTTPYEPDRLPYYPSPLTPAPLPAPARLFWTRCLNLVGLACQTDYWGCSTNLPTEIRWVFGSSRNFFGEVCVPCQHGAERVYAR